MRAKKSACVLLQSVLLAGITALLCSCTSRKSPPPTTAAKVDVSRYAGRWYEIARLPMPFQKANEAAFAEYALLPDGTLSVHNTAIRPDGTRHGISGYAVILNPPENTKLAVHFKTWFAPFIPIPSEGNYWILHVGKGYQEALVGTPDRKYLWVLARQPIIPEEQLQELLARANSLGFDISGLIRDPQKGAGN